VLYSLSSTWIQVRLELPRFRGHLTHLEERSPDAETTKALPT